jgi:iron complex outermembrane receptor protein
MPSHRPSYGSTRRRSNTFASCVLILTATLAWPAARPALAQVIASGNLADLTIEQLSNIEVTLTTRRAQPLSDVPASAYVISSEDIRRSGATSLPEALRLAPTLQVARADANQYAISARGFNNVLANKMLVMIDGRAIYSPLFSGVFWEAQGVMLEDVDRIEVVSGPGGTLWGTNAMNGVINVVTRSAEETQGPLIAAGAGNHDTVVGVRIGTAIALSMKEGPGVAPRSTGHLRVYGQFSSRDDTERSDSFDLPDASDRLQAGFRGDWGDASTAITLQGDLYRGSITQPAASPSGDTTRVVSGGNVLGSWTRSSKTGSQLRIQGYFDYTEREQPGSINESLQSWDIQGQQSFRPASKHDAVWGVEYRYQADRTASLTPFLGFLPPDRDLRTTSLFAQDAVALHERVELTGGVRFERNEFTDWEILPNARLAWKPRNARLLWAAASRAVRAPSRLDREFFSPVTPPHVLLAGGPAFDSEVAKVFELGYRDQPTEDLLFSVTGFHHDYDRLRSLTTSPDGPVFANGIQGTNTGVEIWGSYRVSTAWRFTAGWVQQSIDLDVAAGHSALGGAGTLGNDPKSWGQLRSTLGLGDLDVDAAVRYMGRLPDPEVPSYATLDARVGWRFKKDFEVSLSGWNLTGGSHPEWGLAGARPEFERSVFFKIMMGS